MYMVAKCIGIGREIDQKDMEALVLMEVAWVSTTADRFGGEDCDCGASYYYYYYYYYFII